MKKLLITLGSVVVGLCILGGLGYAFRNQLTNIALSAKPGNAKQYHVENADTLPDNVLKGKNFIFLGSSVTYGSASLGTSFVEYLAKRDQINVLAKEAVSGTTLVTTDNTSYIPRMQALDKTMNADCFVCQLSTNDATKKKELGTISSSTNMADFDVNTITGAIEYIIAYAKATWNCDVVFYTGTKYDSEEYAKMVVRLNELKEKWGISVIDLWNDEEMNAVSKEDYKLYMANGIHPTQAGYLKWWTPKFEESLIELYSK